MTLGEWISCLLSFGVFALWLWIGSHVGYLEAVFIAPTIAGAAVLLGVSLVKAKRGKARQEWRE